MENRIYLSPAEVGAMLNGGYAFQYWCNGVSGLHEGQDAIDFVEQHFAPHNSTYASICFGNNPKIVEAYVAAQDGAAVFSDGIGIGDEVTYYGENTDGMITFPAFV